MPATVEITRLTGSGPSISNITSMNSRVDNWDTQSTGDTANPVTIPSSGSAYSFFCSTQLDCTATPTTLINNLRWFNNIGAQAGSGATVTFTVSGGAINAVTTTPAAGGTGYPASATFNLNVTGGGGAGGQVLATTNGSGVVTGFSATPVSAGSGYTGTTGAATSTGFGLGITCAAGYASAYTQSTVGEVLNSGNYSGLTLLTGPGPEGYTAASPLSLTGSISNPSTGLFGALLVYNFVIGSTASPGASTQCSFYWLYDET